ncbi:VOC family protein [Nocardia sp. NPDC050718]|uniref:VOC family protein n=1 Tax=Nocardia sp. NPDC050718 TaxID=3155788 RepID=UPI0033D751C6
MSDTIAFGGVTIDSNNPAELAEFWTAALGYTVLADAGDFIMIAPPGVGFGEGRYLAFQLVPEPKSTKNRMHIDFQTTTRQSEVDRLTALGATVLGEHALPGFGWTVLHDPQGNEFCVVSPTT